MNRHDTSLDGLLSGLGGVEGSVLKAKRQTMASVGGKMGGSAVAKRGGEVAVGAGEEEGEVAEGSGRAGTVSSSGGGIERAFPGIAANQLQFNRAGFSATCCHLRCH